MLELIQLVVGVILIGGSIYVIVDRVCQCMEELERTRIQNGGDDNVN